MFDEDLQALQWRSIKTHSGYRAEFIARGAALVAFYAPDRRGVFENVVVGYEANQDYVENPYYMGSTVGRLAGRVGGAQIGDLILEANTPPHQLHGGRDNLSHHNWIVVRHEENRLVFETTLSHGASGFPGNLWMQVAYQLSEDGTLSITYHGRSDQDTYVNVTNHAYWNLSGGHCPDICSHTLRVDADALYQLDETQIPTGTLLPVDQTPFDLHLSTPVADILAQAHPQLEIGNGLDHPFQLNHSQLTGAPQAVLACPDSGRRLSLWTTGTCLVVYSGNSLPKAHQGICLEAQNPPVGYHGQFSEAVRLKANESYIHWIRLVFDVQP